MNDQVKQLLDDINIGTLATICQDGRPWATPIHVAYDERWLYWFSREQAVHSQNITFQPLISLVLPQTNTQQGLQGLYLQSSAEKVSPEERHKAIAAYQQKFGSFPEHLEAWSAYRAAIGEINNQKSHGSLWYLYANNQPY